MHTEVKQFIKQVRKRFPAYFFFNDVIEFGSQNINGTPRPFFYFGKYTGVDIGKGKCVDVVCDASRFEGKRQYDVVISTEMLEHDRNWEISLSNMYRNLKPGGLMIITCAGPARPEHGTRRTTPGCSPFTTDYYRNISIEDFESCLPAQLFDTGFLNYGRDCQDLLFCGIKRDFMFFRNYF